MHLALDTLTGFVLGLPALLVGSVLLVLGVLACAVLGVRRPLLALAAALPVALGLLAATGEVFDLIGVGVRVAALPFLGLGLAMLLGVVLRLACSRGPFVGWRDRGTEELDAPPARVW
ncbi:hypothetical protein G9H71_20780, partial [Motilibacter sp. E257]